MEFDPLYASNDLSAVALSKQPAVCQNPVVVIQHRVHASSWNSNTRYLISWYMGYWAEVINTPNRPQFIVFVTVMYPRRESSSDWRAFLGLGSPNKRRIEKELREIVCSPYARCVALLLDELQPAGQEDVEDWLSLNSICSEKARYELIEKMFGIGARQLSPRCMADIEDELRRLVEDLRPDAARPGQTVEPRVPFHPTN